MTSRFPAGSVVVYTSSEPGAAAHDAALPYPVIRDRARTLLPTPRVAGRAAALARRYGCDRVWFGAAAPLALMADRLRREAGVRRIVATTHGHEVWWARTPGARSLLRRIGSVTDTVTHLGEATRLPIAAALGPVAARRMVRLVPGVDADAFRARPGESTVRRRYGLDDRPVILCAARLVPRKGQDMLVRALPEVRRAVPGTTLLLVGDGPGARSLPRAAAAAGLGPVVTLPSAGYDGSVTTGPGDAVVLAGGHPHAAMPEFYAAADVFAMPCRTRRRGLEVEGLGIVFLEAAAAGLPVLAGDSGGAADTVCDGVTGHLVDGRDVAAIAARLIGLLQDRVTAAGMGEKGRDRVRAEWGWDGTYERLAGLLADGGAR